MWLTDNCCTDQVISNWSSLLFWPQQAVHLVSDAGRRRHACDQQSVWWRLCELHARVHNLPLTASCRTLTCVEMTYLLSNISNTLAFEHRLASIRGVLVSVTMKDASMQKCIINSSKISLPFEVYQVYQTLDARRPRISRGSCTRLEQPPASC